MVERCACRLCSSDTKYPDRNKGVVFYPFTKPKTNLDLMFKVDQSIIQTTERRQDYQKHFCLLKGKLL